MSLEPIYASSDHQTEKAMVTAMVCNDRLMEKPRQIRAAYNFTGRAFCAAEVVSGNVVPGKKGR